MDNMFCMAVINPYISSISLLEGLLEGEVYTPCAEDVDGFSVLRY